MFFFDIAIDRCNKLINNTKEINNWLLGLSDSRLLNEKQNY